MKISILILGILLNIFGLNSIASAATSTPVKAATMPSKTPAILPQVKSLPSYSIDTLGNKNLSSIESFRLKWFNQIMITTDLTQKKIDNLSFQKMKNPSSSTDSTEKPILYIKLFLFLFLGFVFGNQIVFYGLLALIVFIILRFLYRKIRRR